MSELSRATLAKKSPESLGKGAKGLINSLLWRDFYRFIVHYAWGNRRRGYDWLYRTVWVHVSGFRVQGSVQESRCSLKESSLLRTSWGLGTGGM